MQLWQKLTDLFETNEITQEMAKRYKDTILCITVGKTNHYASYRGVDDSGFHVFRDKEEQRITLSPYTDYDVSVPRLSSGCYNTKVGAVFLSSLPARQWKRGLSNQNVVVSGIHQFLVNTANSNQFRDVIYDVLTPEYQTECTLKVARQKAEVIGSHACNRKYSVLLDPMDDTDDAYLFYHRSIVGRISGNTLEIMNHAFRQEIIDDQRNLFVDYEVI